jgi:hypothetical protein
LLKSANILLFNATKETDAYPSNMRFERDIAAAKGSTFAASLQHLGWRRSHLKSKRAVLSPDNRAFDATELVKVGHDPLSDLTVSESP